LSNTPQPLAWGTLLFAVGEKDLNWSEALHVAFMQRDATMVPLLELLEVLDDEELELVEVLDEALDDEEAEAVWPPPVDEEEALVWPPPDDDDPGPAPTPDDDPEPLAWPPDPGSPPPFELEQAATSRARPRGREPRIIANLTR
jgi:hypothetical protein